MTDPDMPVPGPDKGLKDEIVEIAKDKPINLIRLAIFAVMMLMASPFLHIAERVLPEEP